MTSGAAAGRYARALFDVVQKEGGNLEQVQQGREAGVLHQDAVAEAERNDIALYTGNDDAIVPDLLTPVPCIVGGRIESRAAAKLSNMAARSTG